MSVSSYRSEAIGHVIEFITLGYDRPAARDRLRLTIANHQRGYTESLAKNRRFVLDLVRAPPSRREAMLREYTKKGDDLSEMGLILGGWQHCRNAVLAFTWILDHGGFFQLNRVHRTALKRSIMGCFSMN